MTFFAHWIPTFAAASVLAVAGLILRAINRRKYGVSSPRVPSAPPSIPEGHAHS
jgi:hypothetical protein